MGNGVAFTHTNGGTAAALDAPDPEVEVGVACDVSGCVGLMLAPTLAVVTVSSGRNKLFVDPLDRKSRPRCLHCPSVSVTLALFPCSAAVAVTLEGAAGATIGVTVKVCALEVPPPGVGVKTVTDRGVPTAAISLAGIVAVN